MSSGVVWLTGRPASGKTTLALRTRRRLSERGDCVVVLDSDELRKAIEPAYDYSDVSRDQFYATMANLAALLAGQEMIVLVAATANRARYRQRARALVPVFVEVYVDTPLETCIERDPKGLYARALADGGGQLPGVGAAYEEPARAEVVVRPGDDVRAIDEILAALDAASERAGAS